MKQVHTRACVCNHVEVSEQDQAVLKALAAQWSGTAPGPPLLSYSLLHTGAGRDGGMALPSEGRKTAEQEQSGDQAEIV